MAFASLAQQKAVFAMLAKLGKSAGRAVKGSGKTVGKMARRGKGAKAGARTNYRGQKMISGNQEFRYTGRIRDGALEMGPLGKRVKKMKRPKGRRQSTTKRLMRKYGLAAGVNTGITAAVTGAGYGYGKKTADKPAAARGTASFLLGGPAGLAGYALGRRKRKKENRLMKKYGY